HVAEAGEHHAGLVSDRDAVVDAAHRDHAHGAARPVHELDVGGQEIVDPVLVDGVRVPTAHLHDLVVPAGLDGAEDLAGERLAEAGVAELVDEPHPAASALMAVPAWTRTRSPGATGATSSTSTSVAAPCSSAHIASPRAWSTLTTASSTAWSPQVMQPSKS